LNGSGGWSEFNIALDADLVLIGPVNAMGMRTVDVVADPMCW